MEKKKQHTVPRCYLENFTDPEGRLHVRRADKIFATKPEGVLTDNHFYTVRLEGGGASFIVEDTLANIEGHFARIYREKISQRLPLTHDERGYVAIFIAAMMLRTRAQRASLEKFFGDARRMVEAMMSVPPEKRPTSIGPVSDDAIPADEFLRAGEDLNTFQSLSMLSNLDAIAQIIFQMNWCFCYVGKKEDFFITSDNPVCLTNPTLETHYGRRSVGGHPGLAQKDVELTLPLSSEMSLLAGWKLDRDGEYLEVSGPLLEAHNNRALKSAYGEVIARDPAVLRKVKHRKSGDA